MPHNRYYVSTGDVLAREIVLTLSVQQFEFLGIASSSCLFLPGRAFRGISRTFLTDRHVKTFFFQVFRNCQCIEACLCLFLPRPERPKLLKET